MTKIAVFLPNWVGDAVMATPVPCALRQHFAGARLIGVLRPYVAGVLEGTAWLDENICLETNGPWSRRWPAVAGWLRRGQIDLAVLFPNSFRSALVAWLGKCRRRVGYRRFARDVLLTDRLTPVRGPDGRLMPSPIIDAYNRLAECEAVLGPAIAWNWQLLLATTKRRTPSGATRGSIGARRSFASIREQLSDRPSIGRLNFSPGSRKKSRIAAEAVFWCSVDRVKKPWLGASSRMQVGTASCHLLAGRCRSD